MIPLLALAAVSMAPGYPVPLPAVPGAANQYAGYLPDPSVTPGAINPDVVQSTIGSTICRAGWTKTVRPPASYTNKLKRTQMQAFALPGAPSLYEEDHFLPLELGGNPTSPSNLWPEKWSEPWGAHRKDVLESNLKRRICAGTISLIDAQRAIQTDWIAAYVQYVGTK